MNGSGLLYQRGHQVHTRALDAYRANFREYHPLRVIWPHGAAPTETELRAVVARLTAEAPDPALTFELAVLRAQLAGHERPSAPPDFPTRRRRLVGTMNGQGELTAILQADMRNRVYLDPGSYGIGALARLSPERTHLHYTWTEEAGYGAHCAGHVVTSERPYRVTDGCDGSRDDAAFYVLRTLLFRLRGWGDREYGAFHRQVYPQERTVPQSITHFSATWRAQEVCLPDAFTAQVFRDLLVSLRDMNHHSLSSALEGLDWTFESAAPGCPHAALRRSA